MAWLFAKALHNPTGFPPGGFGGIDPPVGHPGGISPINLSFFKICFLVLKI
jgi:hypothetical protein